MLSDTVVLSWSDKACVADEIGQFFSDNVSTDYISHSELQSSRAEDIGIWHAGLSKSVAQEVSQRISDQVADCEPKVVSYPVLEARCGGRLVGIALVTFVRDVQAPYAVLEDLIVKAESRDQGIGGAMIAWITQEAVRMACPRIFLESGAAAHGARRLFERHGFHTCSVVMMKRL